MSFSIRNQLLRKILFVPIVPLFLAGCVSRSKNQPPFNPPAVINATLYAPEHLVRVPGGAVALRPSFERTAENDPKLGGNRRFKGIEFMLSNYAAEPLVTLRPSMSELKKLSEPPSPFDLENASPAYYKLRQLPEAVFIETVASPQCGAMTFRWQFGKAFIYVQPTLGRNAMIRFANPLEMEGYVDKDSGERIYFVVRFEWSAMDGGVFKDGKQQPEKIRQVEGKDVGAFFQFATLEGNEFMVKIASSPVSYETVRALLDREVPYWSFAYARQRAREQWETELFQIRVWSDDPKLKELFYVCLSHLLAEKSPVALQKEPAPLFARLTEAYRSALRADKKLPVFFAKTAGAANRGEQLAALLQQAVESKPMLADPSLFVCTLLGILPNADGYVFAPGAFDRIEISPTALGGEKPLVIISQNAANAKEIRSVKWNGKKLEAPFLPRKAADTGGTLKIRF